VVSNPPKKGLPEVGISNTWIFAELLSRKYVHGRKGISVALTAHEVAVCSLESSVAPYTFRAFFTFPVLGQKEKPGSSAFYILVGSFYMSCL